MLLLRNAKPNDQHKRHFAMLDNSKKPAGQKTQIVIKKYANRRLYDTESSTYVTLEDLAQMVRADRDFVVYDAKNGDDLTHAVLTQIIVEQESREGGPTMLPIPFLRQLIRFYDDSMGNMVPSYLQFSLETLSREQEAYRNKLPGAWGAGGFEAYQEHARNNMKIFEQAMAIWTPFKAAQTEAARSKAHDDAQAAQAGAAEPGATEQQAEAGEKNEPATRETSAAERPANEIDALKAELEAMQRRIEKLSQNR